MVAPCFQPFDCLIVHPLNLLNILRHRLNDPNVFRSPFEFGIVTVFGHLLNAGFVCLLGLRLIVRWLLNLLDGWRLECLDLISRF